MRAGAPASQSSGRRSLQARTAAVAAATGVAVLLAGCQGRVADRLAGEDGSGGSQEQQQSGDGAGGEADPGAGGSLDPAAVESVEQAVEEAEGAVASVDEELEND